MNQANNPDLVLDTLLETAAELKVDLSESFIRDTYALFADYQFLESESRVVLDKLRDLTETEISEEAKK